MLYLLNNLFQTWKPIECSQRTNVKRNVTKPNFNPHFKQHLKRNEQKKMMGLMHQQKGNKPMIRGIKKNN